jgi:uncharacterized protein YehS (DUF1456 family)
MVSEEEKQTIESNAKKAGFASAAAYLRSQSMEGYKKVYLWQKSETLDVLEHLQRRHEEDSVTVNSINKIINILNYERGTR